MKRFYLLFFATTVTIIFFSCKDNVIDPAQPTAFDNADGIKGGISYDKFWATEANYSKMTDVSLLAKLNTSSDFFRCKQCHAWDLLGSNGSYINRGPKTSRPNVSNLNLFTLAKTKSAQELFDGIKKSTGRRDISYDLTTYNPTSNAIIGDQMPNYSQLLTDAEIWNLVKFLKNEVIDVTQLYDATYTGTYPTGKATFTNIGKDGNATNGKTYYNNKCTICHGADGKLIPNLDGTTGMTLGKFVRTKSNEAQHKIKFGQLGTPMTASKTTLQELKDLYKAAADTVAYPNK
ncbi:MAG: cytochrome c [Bacteroidota bacterium]